MGIKWNKVQDVESVLGRKELVSGNIDKHIRVPVIFNIELKKELVDIRGRTSVIKRGFILCGLEYLSEEYDISIFDLIESIGVDFVCNIDLALVGGMYSPQKIFESKCINMHVRVSGEIDNKVSDISSRLFCSGSVVYSLAFGIGLGKRNAIVRDIVSRAIEKIDERIDIYRKLAGGRD